MAKVMGAKASNLKGALQNTAKAGAKNAEHAAQMKSSKAAVEMERQKEAALKRKAEMYKKAANDDMGIDETIESASLESVEAAMDMEELSADATLQHDHGMQPQEIEQINTPAIEDQSRDI